MTLITCTACPSWQMCKEAETCLNAVVVIATNGRRAAHCPPATPTAPAPAAAPQAPRQAARTGSVVAVVQAACETALVAAGGPVDDNAVRAAAKAALPGLLADGINENSARKGVSVWARNRLSTCGN